ncbi:hypothetical protein PCANC_03303 [Puccinia coronata f. sp. avenae]|uniref:Dynein intermediate chain, cytosolic n=1 Tax=Puccinia coronata f. sp. avenae TaxID=200324 RepID=A0A2N5UTI4_9BASI|nr:hypothetical protein PCASD_07975 [Puccinia coronata f. sp. avenae]PLW55216.1 hypothetical protein PCANC_03303 [Puccinia coronata f. sp. avenae]
MDRRRQDIEDKRAKLAELRKAREERRTRLQEERDAGSTTPINTSIQNPRPTRAEIDSLVSDLLSPAGGHSSTSSGLASPVPYAPSTTTTNTAGKTSSVGGGRVSFGRRSSQGSHSGGQITSSDLDNFTPQQHPSSEPQDTPGSVTGATPLSSLPQFTDSSQDLYEIAPKPRLLYNKSVQTHSISVGTGPSGSNISNGDPNQSVTNPNEEELRLKLIKELETERKKLEQEIKDEQRRIEKEMEEDRLRGLDPRTLAAIYSDAEFNEFLESSSKIIQRALSDGYDYLKDYSMNFGDEDGMDDREGKRVKRSCEFYDEKLLKNRSVTDLDWSTKNPELSLAAYNKNPSGINEPDGLVCVWNLHLLDRPEYTFHSQSDVLSATFSPFHPNLVIGGTYSGQILIWDIRHRKQLPVLKTPLSSSGHTHPVYSTSIIGTQNSHNLISVSTDGTICSWALDMLAQPQDLIEVLNPAHHRTDEMSPTCFSLPANEINTIWFGTEEGNVYETNRFDRAGMKSGLIQNLVFKGHSGPVLGIDFHPMSGPVDFSDLFLTCGVDWTVKLWRPQGNNKKTEQATEAVPTGRQPRLNTTPVSAKPHSAAPLANIIPPIYSFEEADDYIFDVKWHPCHPAMFATVDGSGKFNLWNLNTDTEVPTVSIYTNPSQPRGLNKLAWDKREGKKVSMGSIDGRVYVYDIGELALPKENEWDQMRKTFGSLVGTTTNSISALGDR